MPIDILLQKDQIESQAFLLGSRSDFDQDGRPCKTLYDGKSTCCGPVRDRGNYVLDYVFFCDEGSASIADGVFLSDGGVAGQEQPLSGGKSGETAQTRWRETAKRVAAARELTPSLV